MSQSRFTEETIGITVPSDNGEMIKVFKLNCLLFLFLAFLLTGCLSSYVNVDLVKKISSKTLLSLFVSDITTDKKFGKSGELNLNTDIGNFLLRSDLNIRGVNSDNQNGLYIELGELGAGNKIIRINSEGIYDSNFGTIDIDEGLKATGEYFKIYHVYSNGSFLVGGPGIASSCPNSFTVDYHYPCLVLKKYLASGKLDVNFSNDGVLDLPVSLETNNYGMFIKVLSNSQIFIASQFEDPNSATGIVPFYNLLSEDGAVLIANRIPDIQNFTPFEQIVDVKEIAASKLQVTSRYQGTVYKRILNADLTADNTYNSNQGYSSVNFQEAYMVTSFLKGDDIIFLQNTTQMDAGLIQLDANYYSSIGVYNRTTEAILEQRIHNPVIGSTGRTFIRGGIFNSQDDEVYLFALTGNGSGAMSQMITKYKTDTLTLDTSYQSSGFLTFPGFVSGMYLPFNHFFVQTNQHFFEFSDTETVCDADNYCKKSFFERVFDTDGAPSTTTDIPLNGKIADFKILRQLKYVEDPAAFRIFNNGEMLILYAEGNSSPKKNENFLIKISSAGKVETAFGVNGLLEFGKGIIKDISKYNNNYYVFYYDMELNGTLTFYVKKLNENGVLDSNFGVGGRALIDSGLPDTTSYGSLNGGAPRHAIVDKKLIVAFEGNIVNIDDNSSTSFFNYKINLDTFQIQKNTNLFLNVQSYISSNYPNGYSLYYGKTVSAKTMFLLKGLKNGAGDFDVVLFAVDANGDFIPTFGVNGAAKLKEITQGVNNYHDNIPMSFEVIDNKIQILFSRIEMLIAEQELYGDSSFMIINNINGSILSQENISNGANYDLYLASLANALSFSSTIFSGLKAQEYHLLSTPEYKGFLSYLSVENGVTTYKEVDFEQSDILNNAVVMTMQPVAENLYVSLAQKVSGKAVYKYVKLSPR